MENLAKIKQRVIYFIENQGIKKEDFYKKISSNGANFRGKSLKSEISGDKIAEILANYNEINPEWLITGKGEMLKSIVKNTEKTYEKEPISLKDENISKLISILDNTIKEKDRQIDRLLSIIENINKHINN